MFAIVEESEKLVHSVREAVRAEAIRRKSQLPGSHSRELLELRDEAHAARSMDLPTLLDQLNASQALYARRQNTSPLPDLRAPFFASMRVREDSGRERVVLIGHQSLVSEQFGVSVLNWEDSGLGKIFLQHRDNEEFELEVNHRKLSGTVLDRRYYYFDLGNLVGVASETAEFEKRDSDWVHSEFNVDTFLHGGAGTAVRGFSFAQRHAANNAVRIQEMHQHLDEIQRSALELPADRNVLLTGGAGSGKSTVAVLRAAEIFAKDPTNFAQHKMLVIVPEQGLLRFIRKLLDGIGMDRVVVQTIDGWIHEQMRHLYPDSIRALCSATPAAAIRFKSNPAVLSVFDELKQEKWNRAVGRITKHFRGRTIPKESLTFSKTLNFTERCEKLYHDLVATFPKDAEWAAAGIESFRRELLDVGIDRQFLMQNSELLRKIAAHSDDALSEIHVKAVLSHERDQLTKQEVLKSSDLDPEYTKTLDDRDVDEADEDDVFNTIDAEDLIWMAHLLHFYGGSLSSEKSSVHRYRHIIVDEAQELGLLELQLLKKTVEEGASWTLAGDDGQFTGQVATEFRGWQKTTETLAAQEFVRVNLRISYRCPSPVIEFAQSLLPSLSREEIANKKGEPVYVQRSSGFGHNVCLIRQAIEDIISRERDASVCVLTREWAAAKRIARSLQDFSVVRLVRDGDFSFVPGVDICTVEESKGLEFDYVIIPDADLYNYPNFDVHRRFMYLAATRAVHQLWVLAPVVPSPLLPKFSGIKVGLGVLSVS